MQTLPVRAYRTDCPRVGQRINHNSATVTPKPLATGATTAAAG